MNIPKEFRYLATCFSSRSDRDYETVEEWVESRVHDCLLPAEKRIVARFLADLLSDSPSDDDLQRLWEKLDSDYWFESGAGVRVLFTMIKEAAGRRN